jgi:hypothetical protein
MQTFEIFVSDSRTSWHVGTQAKGNCPIHSKRMQEWEGETTESASRISPSAVQVCTILLQSSTEDR